MSTWGRYRWEKQVERTVRDRHETGGQFSGVFVGVTRHLTLQVASNRYKLDFGSAETLGPQANLCRRVDSSTPGPAELCGLGGRKRTRFEVATGRECDRGPLGRMNARPGTGVLVLQLDSWTILHRCLSVKRGISTVRNRVVM